ncbi:tRNA nuclease WapA precursor [Pirellula sp. SH-Sr6A]|uniref:RHS repeat domain-containing protein n=1 Tax=Pirellula sp. SH-Sr6A TaxID=1632865 RepID=UPI00078E3D27|nr:RHS repeat-associated core domain-containing protein [Pirellula sp. SH-Sr6A]AMV34095.1 tRNA nuclease WapA precursor [Pirellula sp. SH-Sr6A]
MEAAEAGVEEQVDRPPRRPVFGRKLQRLPRRPLCWIRLVITRVVMSVKILDSKTLQAALGLVTIVAMHPQNAMLQTSPELRSARPRTGEPTATFGCTEATIPSSQCFHVHSINASVGPSPAEATTATWHYHRNQQFSITAVTTSSGSVAERYAYTAYGQPTILDGSGSVLSSSAINNRYTYTGREWDATLGLYHFRARWMSPWNGRFVQRDPSGYRDSKNAYVYVRNRPIRRIDPSGEVSIITTADTLSSTTCPGPDAGKTTFGMIYQFRVENKCQNKSGWIIQEVTASCASGNCRAGTCPANKSKAKTARPFYEAWRVSGTKDPTIPDQESDIDPNDPNDDYDYTDTSTITGQVQFETCGYQKAIGVVRFFCDEDIPRGEAPSDWIEEVRVDTGDSGCPLFVTGGLPDTTKKPSYWGSSKESEATRFYEINWNCCCDAESFGITQDGSPRGAK